MKKVLIVNQGFTLNMGDKAIQYALKRFFEDKGFKVVLAGYSNLYKDKTFVDNVNCESKLENIVKSGSLIKNNNIYNEVCRIYNKIKHYFLSSPIGFVLSYFKSEREKLLRHIKEITDDYDLVIIGGGQLIKTNNLFTLAFRAWSKFSILKSKKNAVIGVGINPSFSYLELLIYKKYLKYYNNIYLRDKTSVKRAINLFDADAKFIPDVAFIIKKYIQDKTVVRDDNLYIVMPYDYHTYHRSFNSDMTENEYNKFWLDKILYLFNSNKRVELMYTTPEDRKHAEIILNTITDKKIKKSIHIVDCYTVEEFIRKLQSAQKVIAARMHALILGMVAGCEVESVNISDKLVNFEKDYINSKLSVSDYCSMIEKVLNQLI